MGPFHSFSVGVPGTTVGTFFTLVMKNNDQSAGAYVAGNCIIPGPQLSPRPEDLRGVARANTGTPVDEPSIIGLLSIALAAQVLFARRRRMS